MATGSPRPSAHQGARARRAGRGDLVRAPNLAVCYELDSFDSPTMINKARDLNQLIDLVHEAVYEIDELRACLEHDDDEAAAYTPYLDSLDKMLRDLHETMVSGNYAGVGQGEDLAFMPLFRKHERDIPFRELLRTINATHREGFEV